MPEYSGVLHAIREADMRRSTTAGMALISVVALTACGGPSDPGTPSDEPIATPSESTWSTSPSLSVVEGWPRSVPVPPGAPVDGQDTVDAYTVQAERADFDRYADRVAAAKGADEILSTGQDAFQRIIAIDGQRVVIELDRDAGTMTVSIS